MKTYGRNWAVPSSFLCCRPRLKLESVRSRERVKPIFPTLLRRLDFGMLPFLARFVAIYAVL
jgi:hypothetical protein